MVPGMAVDVSPEVELPPAVKRESPSGPRAFALCRASAGRRPGYGSCSRGGAGDRLLDFVLGFDVGVERAL